MSALMDSLAAESRITARIFRETFGGVQRTGWMNLIIIVTMASILSIFGTLFAVVMELQLFVNNVGSGLEISAYLRDGADLSRVGQEIQALPHIKRVTLVSKDAAWDDMKRVYNVPEIQNPLPDTLHIQMTDQRFIEATVEKLKQMAQVEQVNYAQNVLEKLQQIARVASVVGIGVSIFLGTLTMFIISNTIHLLIQARGREIEILRMMGVGNWYIRLPFLFQGAFYGLLGACIAYIPLSVAEYYLSTLFHYFQFSTSAYSHSIVSMILILMGIFVGGGGATMAVHKYLRV